MQIVLMLDEMYIMEGLVYNKHTGQLIDLGSVNKHLLEFERSVLETEKPRELAKTMMCFMVRGLFTPLRFLYTQFPCCKVTGELLFHRFWEAICRLERIGLMVIDIIIYKINIILLMQVLAVTFDGSSINRRLLKIT